MNKYFVLMSNDGFYYKNDHNQFWHESLHSASKFKSKKDARKMAEIALHGIRDRGVIHIEIKMFITNENVTYYEI